MKKPIILFIILCIIFLSFSGCHSKTTVNSNVENNNNNLNDSGLPDLEILDFSKVYTLNNLNIGFEFADKVNKNDYDQFKLTLGNYDLYKISISIENTSTKDFSASNSIFDLRGWAKGRCGTDIYKLLNNEEFTIKANTSETFDLFYMVESNIQADYILLVYLLKE